MHHFIQNINRMLALAATHMKTLDGKPKGSRLEQAAELDVTKR